MSHEERIDRILQFVLQEHHLLSTADGHVCFCLAFWGMVDQHMNEVADAVHREKRRPPVFSEN